MLSSSQTLKKAAVSNDFSTKEITVGAEMNNVNKVIKKIDTAFLGISNKDLSYKYTTLKAHYLC
ncbi:hypothetical protein GCM10022271_05180 [Corallibacter vietnamensis]|uniref:Uncharacterized protein n=1 Tax=Corallibacter vietnamensis TaxID=904130 RepID=A0ABP7GUA5_9FLAO